MYKNNLILLLSCILVLGLSACSRNEDVSVSSENYGSYESKEVIQEIDKFAVDENIEVESETVVDTNIYYNKYINENRGNFTNEEIAELNEIDNDTYVNKITGEVVNFSDLRNVDVMIQDAANGWKEDYKNGEVTKQEVSDYFNIMYEEIDEKERQKVIDEIISDDKEVDISSIEYDETCSPDELQEIIRNLEKEGISCNGSSSNMNNSDVQTGDSTGLPALQSN